MINLDVQKLKKNVNTNLKAEIIFYELENLIKNKSEALAKFVGVSKRSYSKDLVDLSTKLYLDETGYTNESLVLHLTKNSIYHNLPELLFHPLSISNSTMSNKEIVKEVKKNKNIETEALEFFMPFDNEIFKMGVKLANRSLHLLDDNKKLFFKIIDDIIDIDYDLPDLQKKNLFIFLCEAQKLKENLTELEKLLSLLLDIPVKLKYKKHFITKTPYQKLSKGVLGQNLGLCGVVESEMDDLEVNLFFNGKIDYVILTKKIELTKKILEYFIIATRKIEINFFNNYQLGIKLNENYLGINTVI